MPRFQFNLRALPASTAAKWTTLFSLVVCTTAVLATTGVFLRGANLRESLWFPVLLDGVVVSPYLGLATLALSMSRNTTTAVVVTLGTILIAVYGALVMVDLYVNHPDPQNGFLLLLVALLCQWPGVVATFIVAGAAWLIDRMLQHR